MEVAQPSTFMLSSSLRSLSSDYLTLLDCGPDRFVDIAFCIDSRTYALIYAHCCIMSARSPFFRLIFSPSSSSTSSSSSSSSFCNSSTSSSFHPPQSHSPPASRNHYVSSISVSQCYLTNNSLIFRARSRLFLLLSLGVPPAILQQVY